MVNENYVFNWNDLGDIELGRPNLGDSAHIAMYRLMHFTMRHELVKEFGTEKAEQIIFSAGKVAGLEFCKNLLDVTLDINGFISQLQDRLTEYKVGILRIEKFNPENLDITLTVSEDLDCSGLALWSKTVCVYDEGFIAGVLENYTGHSFDVKEVDCWSTGARTCRFEIRRLTK